MIIEINDEKTTINKRIIYWYMDVINRILFVCVFCFFGLLINSFMVKTKLENFFGKMTENVEERNFKGENANAN